MTWPFGELKPFSFDLVVADPPWLFELRSIAGEAKSAQAQYECMPLEAIKTLPVGHLVRMNSWLFLWATAPMLPDAIDTMRAWGFEYRSRVSWRKVTEQGKNRVGPGYIVRSMHEDILVGVIGRPLYTTALPSIFDGLAREHSRKPEEFYRMVEAFAPSAERLDLFGRSSRPGWATFGDQANKFDAGGDSAVVA